MQISGLTNTPITKTLLIYTITSSIALSILDLKHMASIQVAPHFWPYAQLWRALIWQVAGFANSTEALFAALLVYHLRVVERGWGARKMATFVLTTLPYTTLLPPLLLALFLRPLSLNNLNYLPSGPTAAIFALLAQYHAAIPHVFRYRIGTTSTSTSTSSSNATINTPSPSSNTQSQTQPASTSKPTNTTTPSLTLLFSDKSTTYIIAVQLALSQFPSMLLPAVVGWVVGVAWRTELLPGLSPSSNGFRVPAWIVGEQERRGRSRAGAGSGIGSGSGGHGVDEDRGRYEDLRRRLEGEVAASASASGLDAANPDERGRGSTGDGFVERLRRAF